MASALTEQLDVLLQGPRESRDLDTKVALSRLAAEVKRRLDAGSAESYDFLSSTLKALSRFKSSVHADARMACLFDCASYFFANRHHAEALECAHQLGVLARQVGDKKWLRRALMLKGVAYSHLGDCGEAVQEFSIALPIARELADFSGESAVLNNLGIALNYAGLYREAIPCLQAAIAVERDDAPLYRASALCNLAQSLNALGEHQDALHAISACLEQSPEPTDAYSAYQRAIREFTFVQIALELGKLSAARQHTQSCISYARRCGLASAAFIADLAQGLCDVHGGDVVKGISKLERALENPTSEKGTPEYADALMALIRAYDQAMQPERALERMAALLDEIRKRRELGVNALLAIGMRPISEDSDLSVLTTRAASLRAQVAEREAINSRIDMLERLAIAADLREEASGQHGYRVGQLAFLLGEALNWPKDALVALELAARLHDLGKVAMPDRILLTTKELQAAERHFMSTHTTIGAELLGKSNIPQLRMAEEIARYHHEWWNGEGYPSKLKGKRIPIHARIVALADVFDALTHGRPFSPPWPIDKALDEIRARKGTQFDPELTDLFLELIERLRKEHEDLDEYLGRAGKSSPFLQARNRIRQMLADEREHEKMATMEGNQTRH